jgi:hypothetical protein
MQKEKFQGGKIIFTVIAKKKENLEILFQYIENLYLRKSIHEIHVWDYTEDLESTSYLDEYFFKGKRLYYSRGNNKIKFVNDMIIDEKYKLSIDNDNIITLKYCSENNVDIENTKDRIINRIASNNNLNSNITYHGDYLLICDYKLDILNRNEYNSINIKYPNWKLFKVSDKNTLLEYYSNYCNIKLNNKFDDKIMFNF